MLCIRKRGDVDVESRARDGGMAGDEMILMNDMIPLYFLINVQLTNSLSCHSKP
jgi:hypothetical protein